MKQHTGVRQSFVVTWLAKMLNQGSSVVVVTPTKITAFDMIQPESLYGHYIYLLRLDARKKLVAAENAIAAMTKGLSGIIHIDNQGHRELSLTLRATAVPVVHITNYVQSTSVYGFIEVSMPGASTWFMKGIANQLIVAVKKLTHAPVGQETGLDYISSKKSWRKAWGSVLPAKRLSRIYKVLKREKQYKRPA